MLDCKASNFAPLGDTLGYSRSAGSYHHHGKAKRVWLYALRRDARGILSAPFPHPLLRADDRGVDVNTLPISGDGGLLSVLEALTDPRKKRGIRHKVAAILTMVAAATLGRAPPVSARSPRSSLTCPPTCWPASVPARIGAPAAACRPASRRSGARSRTSTPMRPTR